jgi:hypothetical protein
MFGREKGSNRQPEKFRSQELIVCPRNTIRILKSRHVACVGDVRYSYKILVQNPEEKQAL